MEKSSAYAYLMWYLRHCYLTGSSTRFGVKIGGVTIVLFNFLLAEGSAYRMKALHVPIWLPPYRDRVQNKA